jgi:hypothetical protein
MSDVDRRAYRHGQRLSTTTTFRDLGPEQEANASTARWCVISKSDSLMVWVVAPPVAAAAKSNFGGAGQTGGPCAGTTIENWSLHV